MAQGNGDNTTITIEGRVTVTGDVRLILADGCTLIVNGGIQVAAGNSLTIYGQSEDETTMGKLTSQNPGDKNAGIGGTGNTAGTAGNAVIFASSATGSSIQDTSNQSSWQGVFFLGNEAGKIYGTSVTPTEDFTIPSGKTLTIENGKILTIQAGVTVTNEGTLTVEAGGKLTVSEGGTLTVEAGGTLTGSVNDKQPPQITASPADVSATEGSAATFTVTASAGEGESADTLSYQWQQKTTSEGSAWEDISGAAAYSDTTETTNTGMSGYQYRCVVTGEASRVSVVSSAATLTVTAKVPVTSVTLDKDTLNLTVGGTGTLTATVSPDTATDKTVIWSSDHPEVATVENGTVTAVGAGTAKITVTTEDGNHTATCTVTVTRPSSGGGSRPTPTPSQQAVDKIESAKEGATVAITLKPSQTTLDKEVFEELSGRDVTLEISLPGGITWTVNGQDIPENAVLTDLDMGVRMDAGSVPVDILNAITGEIGTMQLRLAHDGEFGFTLTLTAPLGSKNAGYWANLYYYHEDAESLTFQTSAKIGPDGSAALVFTHASDYVIVIDDRDHTPKEFPFVDVTTDDWFYEAADYVFQRDLMTGTDATHFTPDGTSTRAMVATILWRMAGQPQADYTMDFADVPVSAWYTEAVRWAASEGIVTGYSATKFGPDDPVTREQFAAMLYRYAQTLGEGFTGNWSFPLDFPDAADVSDYAYEALCWLTMENVIQGMEDGNLHPQGTANRAQLATMLMRFCQAADQ